MTGVSAGAVCPPAYEGLIVMMHPRLRLNPRLLYKVKRSGRRISSLSHEAGFSSLSRMSAILHDGIVVGTEQNVEQLRALAVVVDFQEPIFVDPPQAVSQ